jgi:signal peptidase I
MIEAEALTSVNPWRALWLHPGLAVEAVIARNWRTATLALAAIECIVALLAATGQPFHLFDLEPGGTLWLVVLLIALAGAVLGIVGLYVTGWVVNVVARTFGGRGAPAGVRAAIAWGSVPLLISSVVGLAMRLGAGENEAPSVPLVLAGAAAAVCFVWGVVWQIAMLARVQKFGAARALLSGLVGCIGVPFVLALAIRTFAFQPFDAPSASMAPTLQRGDYFFVSKFAYGYGRYSFPFAPAWFAARIFAAQPKRGDVVVFVHPKDGTDWVKRIVGLPGDTVQMKDGRLLINGEMVERHRIEPGFKTQGPFGDAVVAPTYDETLLGGGTHRIIEIEDGHGFLDNTDVFLTPPNAYFVLGDNRDNSMDSRVGIDKGGVGFVPFENIVGRAAMIYYSIDPDSQLGRAAPRLERIGLAVE